MTDFLRKAFTPHDLKLSETGEIELAFAQLNVIDSDGDVTLPGAFAPKSVPMSAYGHTSWDGALPVGKGSIAEVGDWAVFKGQFFMDTTAGRDTYATVKGLGELAEYSYGYSVLAGEPGSFEGKRVRYLKSLDTHEVSPVLKGAGVGTHTMSIKSGAPVSDASMSELLSRYSEVRTALSDRIKAHAASRVVDGRWLSRVDQAIKADFEEAMKADLEEMLALVPFDPAKQAAFEQAYVENLLAIARANGVPLS